MKYAVTALETWEEFIDLEDAKRAAQVWAEADKCAIVVLQLIGTQQPPQVTPGEWQPVEAEAPSVATGMNKWYAGVGFVHWVDADLGAQVGPDVWQQFGRTVDVAADELNRQGKTPADFAQPEAPVERDYAAEARAMIAEQKALGAKGVKFNYGEVRFGDWADKWDWLGLDNDTVQECLAIALRDGTPITKLQAPEAKP